jgi:hypothetical protein
MHTSSTRSRTFIVLGLSLVLLLTYNFISAATAINGWDPAPANPPNDNTPAPINIGNAPQTKWGIISVDSLYATTTVIGNIVAAVTEVRSDRYCDSLGQNCRSASSTVDLSSLYTYNTLNNNRSVTPPKADAPICSCNEGDFLTGCSNNEPGHGYIASGDQVVPYISKDPNSCTTNNNLATNAEPVCTCLSTKPRQGMCTVTITTSYRGLSAYGTPAFNDSSDTIQLPRRSTLAIGVFSNTTGNLIDSRFTERLSSGSQERRNTIYNNGTHKSYTEAGYWNQQDWSNNKIYLTSAPTTASASAGQWWNYTEFEVQPDTVATTKTANTLHANGTSDSYVYPHEVTITANVSQCF